MLPSSTCHHFWVIFCHKCVLINVISCTLSCYLPQTKNIANPPTSDFKKGIKTARSKWTPTVANAIFLVVRGLMCFKCLWRLFSRSLCLHSLHNSPILSHRNETDSYFLLSTFLYIFPKWIGGGWNLDSRVGLEVKWKKFSRLAITRHDPPPPCTGVIFTLILTIQ